MNIVKITGTTNTTYKPNRTIKYIVLHYTAGTKSTQGSARNVAYMFKSGSVGGSADFIVDDAEFIQYNGDIKNRFCWSVGGSKYNTMTTSVGGTYYSRCTNYNSISIEMCSNKTNKNSLNGNDTDWYLTDSTVNNAVELTKYLMQQYKIPASNVIMHHHVTGKVCPNPWCVNESRLSQWNSFKSRLTETPKPDTVHTIVKISINGKIQDYKSINVKGNNYVEARKLLETFGYKVGFNNTKKRITVDDRLTVDVSTIIENSISYIHLRETIDFLNKYDDFKYTQDKTVTYNNNTGVIVIS